jgi:hypothetical protein
MERLISVTNLTKEHEVATKFGVVVFILDDKNRIFTTRELENKRRIYGSSIKERCWEYFGKV